MEVFRSVTFGDMLTIVIIIIGFVHNYVRIIQRITKLEIENRRNKEDIDKLYLFLKNHVTLKVSENKYGKN